MYGGLTAKNSRLCRVQPPGAAPETSNVGVSSVFPIPPQPAQRAADMEWRFWGPAGARPPGHTISRRGSDTAEPIISPHGPLCENPASAFAPRPAFTDTYKGHL